MFHIRTTKTASGATAVQVVRYESRKTIVCFHVGSAHDNQSLDLLQQEAHTWIEKMTQQGSLFGEVHIRTPVIVVNKSEYLGERYTFLYDTLNTLFHLFGFQSLENQLLLDLVLMRIVEPVSKLESLELLHTMFGIVHKRGNVYQEITTFTTLKESVEKKILRVAKAYYGFDFSIVFYDVTTLYFESFKEDEEGLRKPGFSKDNKSNQPQIVIGLIVTQEGFPVTYDVFSGNTFEGKTFIPTIVKFKDTHKVQKLTVVADAAMISLPNVTELVEHNLSYIVGARVANLTLTQINQIHHDLLGTRQTPEEIQQADGVSTRIETERGTLVCDFSYDRYRKDTREMEKQIAKASRLLSENKGVRRSKFLKNKEKKISEQVLNTSLIEKTTSLLGIKGYYTNLDTEKNKTIIDRYHDLWHVEHAFRIAKNDLQMRPIYHFKKQAIEAHILICFMALAICKHMEMKTGKSTKKMIKMLKSISEARILNEVTGEVLIFHKKIPDEIQRIQKTLLESSLSY